MMNAYNKRRILFVDDEPNILHGMQRMLHNMRHEWKMTFTDSGSAALEILARESFDVVVTDMRMPGMDGAQLLNQVQKNYPLILRIILSGYSDHELVLRSVRSAHQYLSKPCDPQLLIVTVRRACRLRDSLNQNSLKRVLSRTEEIPTLPVLYNQIMEELKSSDSSIQRVGRIIANDLGMSAKILHLVNSSFFGLTRHVSDPSQAVILLGLDTVRALVLTIGIFSTFDSKTLSSMQVENIYDHCLRTGAFARMIAKEEDLDQELVDDIFMAGMLHDFGKLILCVNFPQAYQEVLALACHEEMALHEAEAAILGANHAQVGSYFLGLWGLPDSIVEGVAYHHDCEQCPGKGIDSPTVVYAANILEHQHYPCNGKPNDPQWNHFKRLGLDERIPVWTDICGRISGEGVPHA